MAWDDIVGGILTGGLYNAGKTAYKASQAANAAGDAIEEVADGAGKALAIMGETIAEVGDSVKSFITEIEQLVTIKRLTPRDEDDLWDEEKARLEALQEREAELVQELAEIGEEDEDLSFWETIIHNLNKSTQIMIVKVKLAIVRAAIHEILYEEPGVIPTTIYNAKQILENFQTLLQPRLGELLDSVNDNFETSQEILAEVKKLFVIRTWKPVDIASLPADIREQLEVLESSKHDFENLVAKTGNVYTQIVTNLIQVYPQAFRDPSTGGESAKKKLLDVRPLNGRQLALSPLPRLALLNSAINGEEVTAYLGSYNQVVGQLRYYRREQLKLEKEIFRIRYIVVEEPGVIPKLLEELRANAERFKNESQPRIEQILDNLNLTITESTGILHSINNCLKNKILKIALVVGGILVLGIMVMGLIILTRIAFGL